MAGRMDASRDLRLGLAALQSGAIDRDQLVAAVRSWSQSRGRSLSEVLARRGMLDAAAIARLEGLVESEPSPSPAASGTDPTETVDYEGAPGTTSGRPTPQGPGTPGDDAIRGGRYRILRLHSRGGLGEVFLAFDGELNRAVALKELPARSAHDPDAQARFLLEAQLTGALEHPGIVPIHSMGRLDDGRPYYAMRFIEGETLRSAIERHHRGKGNGPGDDDRGLAFQRLLRSVIDACNAVAYAHSRGVVHRDLKPENIMLGRFGETLVVDWGVAKSISTTDDEGAGEGPPPPGADASMTRPGALIGTPRYMSPEQAAGDLDRVGPASDVYSLGAILYCVLVGHAPFPDGDLDSVLGRARRGIFPAPRRVLRSVDPALEAICLKAMSPDPKDRHPSPLDLAHDLEAWQADVRYRGEQELAVGRAKAALARLCLERARVLFEREAHGEGLLWTARALENAPPEPPELGRAIRTSLGAWHAGARPRERPLRHGGPVFEVAFCPEGRRLASACEDRTARLWDISTGAPLTPPLRHVGPVRSVAFRPDGGRLATSGDDGHVRLWDAVTGAPVGVALRVDGPVLSLAFSPDGTRIAAAGPRGFALWDSETGRRLAPPADEPLDASAPAFSRDGSTVAVACGRGVRLFAAEDGAPLGDPLEHEADVTSLAFDPAGRVLLTGGLDGVARLWDAAERRLLLSIPHRGEILAAGFRPSGASFATACGDGTARLWDAASGRPIGEPLTHRMRIDRLAFRPDGTLLATGGPDGTVRLWCAALGLPIGPPLAHGGAVRALAFSPDGRRLASGGTDASVRCWNVPEPVEGGAEQIACWVRVATDLDFDEGDAVRPMDGKTGWDLRRRLTDLGGPPLR